MDRCTDWFWLLLCKREGLGSNPNARPKAGYSVMVARFTPEPPIVIDP